MPVKVSAFLVIVFALFGCVSKPLVTTGPEFELLDLAQLQAQERNFSAAIKNVELASKLFGESGNEFGQAKAALLLGQLYRTKLGMDSKHHRTTPMVRYLDKADLHFSELDLVGYQAYSKYLKIDVYLAADENDEACREYDEALDVLEGTSDKEWQGFSFHPYKIDAASSPSALIEKRFQDFCYRWRYKRPEST